MLIDHLAYSNKLRFVHPAEKAGFVFFCIVASLLAKTPMVPLIVAAVMTGVILFGAGIGLLQWVRLCILPCGFLVMAGVGLAFELGMSSTGLASMKIGMTQASLESAIQTSLRSFGCLTAMLFLASTTPMTDLVRLFHRCKLPRLMTEMLTLTYRSLFVLLSTSEQMRQAQASRLGYCTARASLRSLGMLAASLFTRALERADLSWRAILSRGYENGLLVLEPDYHFSRWRAVLVVLFGIFMLYLAIFLSGEKG